MGKIIGAMLVFFAGYLFSRRLMLSKFTQLSLLEEGELLFRILESEMRNAKTPLPELFLQIAEQTKTAWKKFFQELSGKLEEGCDCEFITMYEEILKKTMGSFLEKEELSLFFSAGRNLLSDDVQYQRKHIEQLSAELCRQIAKKKMVFTNQKKVCEAVCLSASALLIIMLL